MCCKELHSIERSIFLRKRFYIMLVARNSEGELLKIPIPLHYLYVFIAGALIGMGIPEYEAKRYEGRVKQGGILLSVHADSSEWVKRAEDILERTGATDVSSAGEAAADYATSDRPGRR